MFENDTPARVIFKGLLARLGKSDENSALRIVFVRGISAANPHHYSVIVSSNLNNSDSMGKKKIFGLVARICTMTPSSPQNLNLFQDIYQRSGRCLLAPAILQFKDAQPNLLTEYAIGIHKLHFRDAWTIEENDPDMMVLNPDDPPLIPKEQPNAPVLKALALARKIRDKRRGTNT
jgi:hypothetical protein